MRSKFSSVCVIGLGYIGLPTATTIASRGVPVTGVDISPRAVQLISNGQAHFSEPDLDVMVQSVVHEGMLRAVAAPEPADAFIVCVPTPFDHDKQPNLSCVEAAARSLAPVLKRGDLIILESTSPVGTTEKLAAWIKEARPDLTTPLDDAEDSDLLIAYCPERILPGRMLFELINNQRVIGGLGNSCAKRAKELYEIFVAGEMHATEARTAELVKLTENAYRDVNIAFANELSLLCDQLGTSVWETIRLANLHPRVDVLSPGPGVGGHCISVDPWFLIHSAPEATPLLQAARTVNVNKTEVVAKRVVANTRQFSQPIVACFGLAYKANIDDLRESPALQIVKHLAQLGNIRVVAVEPNIETLPSSLAEAGNVKLVSLDEALVEANVLALLVDHREFFNVPASKLAGKAVIDTKGIWTQVPTIDSVSLNTYAAE